MFVSLNFLKKSTEPFAQVTQIQGIKSDGSLISPAGISLSEPLSPIEAPLITTLPPVENGEVFQYDILVSGNVDKTFLLIRSARILVEFDVDDIVDIVVSFDESLPSFLPDSLNIESTDQEHPDVFNDAHFSEFKSITLDGSSFVITEKLGESSLTEDQEKHLIADIKFRAKQGQSMSIDDVLSLIMSSTSEAKRAIEIISNGGQYLNLRTAGLTDGEALKALAIFHVKIDTDRYQSERALQVLSDDPSLLSDFGDFLSAQPDPKELPGLENYLVSMRSNIEIYDLVRQWHTQRVQQ